MSLYYKPYENDADLMNLLIEKWGYNMGMAKFRKCKNDSGYHEVVSYEGAARITRWVKNEKTPKAAVKPDVKPDSPKSPKSPKPDAPKPAAAAAPKSPEQPKQDWKPASPYGSFGGGWGGDYRLYNRDGSSGGYAANEAAANAACAAWGVSRRPPMRVRRCRQNAAGQETDSFGNPVGGGGGGSLLFDDSDDEEAVVPIPCVKDGKDDC